MLVKDFAKTIMEPPPPVIPLLTMIRINEAVFDEVQRRGCSPLETFIIGQRLTMWPIFQKEMSAHVESLKRLSDGASGGYLTRGVTLKDSLIQKVPLFCHTLRHLLIRFLPDCSTL